ncbi:hypothetical protein [Pseudobacteriovorax antillogorgiicola]|uniref:Concanavalin A-like lectin/glucanases superfamily protein n=1 Tax=Pseudobacteriovorax antillogorgiicola TaxID=1513793 RepID=A0A1Y6BNV7_9BACT|nr:hypothetical protein [Pseudobacteriovorax antillogorgiicola]TCS55373.1 hypothetical protein EDD56_10594 [Pseudobacteriovorax antillogorgiicola]SMF13403.1 hypothetical protein SAMN06296036_105230 [Pseudobacteriovorax antillogorgiicola]
MSVILASQPLEAGDELLLYVESVDVEGDGNRSYNFPVEDGLETSIRSDNNWLSGIIANQQISNGSYHTITLNFKKEAAGIVKQGENSIVVNHDSGTFSYPIAAPFTIEDGKSALVYLKFEESEGLVANEGSTGIESYTLKNGFRPGEVSINKSDALVVGIVPEQAVATPLITNGILFHYDSTKVDSLFLDENCQIPANVEGQGIGCWQDISGNGFHLTQPQTNRRPTIAMNQFQSRIGIAFDGNDNRFERDMLIDPVSSHTVVIVARFNQVNDDQRFFSLGKTDRNEFASLGVENGQTIYTFRRNELVYNPTPVEEPLVFVASYDGSDTASGISRQLFSNGIVQVPSSNNDLGGILNIADDVRLFIGASHDGDRLDGSLLEVIFYNRALSSTELSQVHQFLNEKYQLVKAQ